MRRLALTAPVLGRADSGNHTVTSATPSSFSPGNGMVEIAALTTLVGSSSAEILMFGTRGSAGLPWAAMSAFGALSIVRACISGASPAWLSETLGIRGPLGDSILGMALNLDKDTRGASKLRRGALEAVGIACKTTIFESQHKRLEATSTREDVYQFNRNALVILDALSLSSAGSPPRIYICVPSKFTPRPYQTIPFARPSEWVMWACSSIKLVELSVLWHLDGLSSAVVFGLPWAYFFLASMALQVASFLEKGEDRTLGPVDYLIGRIPLAQREGRERAILLGARINTQQGTLWRAMWALGALVEFTSTILAYVQLNQIANSTVYVWVVFQILWLGTRIVFHHFTSNWNEFPCRATLEKPWAGLDARLKLRILELVMSVAKYQSHLHPRGDYSYRFDLLSSTQLQSLFFLSRYRLTREFPLRGQMIPGKQIKIEVVGVVGDTLFSSASWIKGGEYNGLDLFDCCLVFLLVNNKTYAIPSVRALSGKAATLVFSYLEDTESGENAKFVPKGASNYGWGINWYFWIPGQDGLWIEMVSEDETMKFLGLRQGVVLNETSLHAKLKSGELMISLTGVKDVKQTLEISRNASKILLDFFPQSKSQAH
ncbi:hypothetical protein DL96DRAFT_1534294 [Flagelloscypha sp. PMI_526]|nr:hypothetical protein DL96DRAFT_1534294 [Flagelloscypha sp. PMI_526]